MTDFTLAQEDASIGQSEAWTRPAEKKYASLSREHSLALLHKLSTDDGFRNRFEENQAAALAELGVAYEVNSQSQCVLGDKATLAAAYQRLLNDSFDTQVVPMIIPNISLDFGKR